MLKISLLHAPDYMILTPNIEKSPYRGRGGGGGTPPSHLCLLPIWHPTSNTSKYIHMRSGIQEIEESYCVLNLNSSKKVRKLEFHRSYFPNYHVSNIVFDINRKPVYLSLN